MLVGVLKWLGGGWEEDNPTVNEKDHVRRVARIRLIETQLFIIGTEIGL